MRNSRKGLKSGRSNPAGAVSNPVEKKQAGLDSVDVQLLEALQRDCRIPLEKIAKRLKVPRSTVHYRIRRLEQSGVIENYFAKVNATKVGKDYLALVMVRAKHGPRYHLRVGRRIAAIPGVSAVYAVLGETDLILMIRANDRDDLMHMLEKITSMPNIVATNTQVIFRVVKEDPRIALT